MLGNEQISLLRHIYYAFRGIPFAEPPMTGIDPYTGEKVDRGFKVRKPFRIQGFHILKVCYFNLFHYDSHQNRLNAREIEKGLLHRPGDAIERGNIDLVSDILLGDSIFIKTKIHRIIIKTHFHAGEMISHLKGFRSMLT